MQKQKKSIGILALQGSFAEHKKMMERIGVDVVLISSLLDVKDRRIDGVILPGGESTTMKKLLSKTGLDKWLVEFGKSKLPIFGTCAGMIVLSDLGLIDAEIERNAYGSQLDSFEVNIDLSQITSHEPRATKGIFIRAPKVISVGDGVEVLAKNGDEPVLIRQKNILAGSFHPELTDDRTVHEYFLKM
ncbi:pyridoxal 5'-phosphate synthase glutaminase subunit PdxT [Candidatus Peregrinibacteria bacterium]|nr:pyridoxal 5'-phosphate synthase glutaminase subunit PdxT [Candidatus Peregrinibacteria bacterium]